jgi:hypothetical protein
MVFNSPEAIARARRDIRLYGSLFNVVAAATRRDDGRLVLPPAGSQEEAEAVERVKSMTPQDGSDSFKR